MKLHEIMNVDPMNLDVAMKICRKCLVEIRKDPILKELVLNIGIFGSTARGTRKLTSDVDIYLKLNKKMLSIPHESVFGIDGKLFEKISKIIIGNFGINTYSKSSYVVDIISEHEIRNSQAEVHADLKLLK